MAKNSLDIAETLNIFWGAPTLAMFDQNVVSIVLQKSKASLERDRFVGSGLPYRRVGRLIRYSKQDILNWLQTNAPTVRSTSEYSTSTGEDHKHVEQ